MISGEEFAYSLLLGKLRNCKILIKYFTFKKKKKTSKFLQKKGFSKNLTDELKLLGNSLTQVIRIHVFNRNNGTWNALTKAYKKPYENLLRSVRGRVRWEMKSKKLNRKVMIKKKKKPRFEAFGKDPEDRRSTGT